MRNLKKFLALVLAMMMAFSLMATASAANVETPVTDVDQVTDEFQEAVQVLNGMGVITGYEDGTFRPSQSVRRSEAAALVYRLVTGDWKNTRNELYSTYVTFTDVYDSHAWAKGYIGYCANQEIIKGVGNGRYAPDSNVTGYQMLAMVLRAMGYGQNKEFEGTGWQTRVASTATQLGMLKQIDNTNYAGTLSASASRELVAEILFQAAQLPMVRYELGYYNPYVGVASGTGNNILNPSLGYRNYGLTNDTGIVLGNQATGEDNTLIGFAAIESSTIDDNQLIANTNGSYEYDSGAATDNVTADGHITVPFDTKTGLDMFGHKARVWYDGRDNADGYVLNAGGDAVTNDANRTYAIIDKAVLAEYVYAEDGALSVATAVASLTANDAKLGSAAIGAGFSVQRSADAGNTKATVANTTANLSDRYSQFETTNASGAAAAATAFTGASPVNMYYLVSNNSGKTVDVAVSLSAEVGKITEKNTTTKDKYLTLGSDDANASEFSNDTAETDRIYLECLTPDSVQDIGKLVTAWQVVGTSFTTTTAASIDGTAANNSTKVMYQLDAVKTVTKQVSNYKGNATPLELDGLAGGTPAGAVTEVTFTDGTSMKLSGITRGDGTNSKIVSMALPIVVRANDTTKNQWNLIATTPRYICENLKANTTYTVYVDVLGRFISMTTTPDVEFIYGTFADFEIGALGTGTSKYAITGVSKDGQTIINHDLTAVDGTTIEGNVGTTYNTLPLTQKDYGNANSTVGNQIKEGANTGYMIDKDGNLTAMTTGDGTKMANGDSWEISANDVTVGVSRVTSNGVAYLLNENTQFYVVEGSGSATLKVTPYKGIKALLDGNNSAEISFATGDDEVVFWTEEDLYGTTSTGNNHNVATVILSDTNLALWGANTMFYSFNQQDATGLTLPGAPASVAQYELYANGEKGTYFIDTAKSVKANGDPWDSNLADTDYETDSIEQNTFYTLTKVDEVNGVPVYRAVGVAVKTDLAYADGLNTGVTYNYIAVNNLNFAELEKNVTLIFNVANAKIADVEYDDGTLADPATSVQDSRSKVTTIEELNNMISVRKTDGTSPVYECTVSVVYDGNNVATIYITEIEAQ